MDVVEETIDIRAPIDQVFVALTDPKRASEWNPSIVEVTQVSNYPISKGSTWVQRISAGGRVMNLSCRVVDYELPHRGTIEVSGDLRGQVSTECEEVAGGTRVRQRIEFVPPGGLLGSLATGFIRKAVHQEMARAMQRQRETLEREAGVASGSEAGH